jgi:mannose-6-phosphate isomerase-like protein (cupin superfamily)
LRGQPDVVKRHEEFGKGSLRVDIFGVKEGGTIDSPLVAPLRPIVPALKRGKGIVQLAGSDLIRGRVQIVSEGGENNLHSHRGMDGFWFVLSGKVTFYGPGDVVIGEFGKHEGILVPRGAEYWFESSGDEDLELLQMAAFEKGVKVERLDAAAAESSDPWNNAGTGHSALCELNYTPENPDGSIDIAKAIAAGADEYMLKPYDRESIEAKFALANAA